jgi:hypothetical protein
LIDLTADSDDDAPLARQKKRRVDVERDSEVEVVDAPAAPALRTPPAAGGRGSLALKGILARLRGEADDDEIVCLGELGAVRTPRARALPHA